MVPGISPRKVTQWNLTTTPSGAIHWISCILRGKRHGQAQIGTLTLDLITRPSTFILNGTEDKECADQHWRVPSVTGTRNGAPPTASLWVKSNQVDLGRPPVNCRHAQQNARANRRQEPDWSGLATCRSEPAVWHPWPHWQNWRKTGGLGTIIILAQIIEPVIISLAYADSEEDDEGRRASYAHLPLPHLPSSSFIALQCESRVQL